MFSSSFQHFDIIGLDVTLNQNILRANIALNVMEVPLV